MDYFHACARWFVELVWPQRCIGCGAIGATLCAPCISALRPLPTQQCPACRRPNALGIPCFPCRNRTSLDRCIAATALKGPVEPLIHALKYRSIRELAAPLGDWLAGVVGLNKATTLMFGSNPLIVPVPLHPSRLRERDYNQAGLLAGRLAAASAMPMSETALVRTHSTGSQVKTHSRAERLDNMRGAFAVADGTAVADRDIVVIDDVCTTGATLEDCARALKEAGARSVSAIVLARG